jgi:hypothetical protein
MCCANCRKRRDAPEQLSGNSDKSAFAATDLAHVVVLTVPETVCFDRSSDSKASTSGGFDSAGGSRNPAAHDQPRH